MPLPQTVSRGSNPGVSQGSSLILRLDWKRKGKDSLLSTGYNSLQAVGWRPLSSVPCGPLHRTTCNMAACIPQNRSRRERGREGKPRAKPSFLVRSFLVTESSIPHFSTFCSPEASQQAELTGQGFRRRENQETGPTVRLPAARG